MPLLQLSADRIAREIQRAAQEERAYALERRKTWAVAGAVAASNALQLFFLGLAMHLTGDGAQAAKAAVQLFGPVPVLIIVIWQLRQEA
jgi:hypothetical protein